eukprot:gene8350-5849_t
MAKKVNAKKKAKFEAQQYVEDLDLDVDSVGTASDDEEDVVVHNKRQRAERSKHANSVLPSDAHRLDGYGDEEYGFAEENELAEQAAKEMRSTMDEDDFTIPGVAAGDGAKRRHSLLPTPAMETPVIETIERDFAALSSSERLAILKKESPELLQMLEDLKKYLGEVKQLAKPLHELLHERKLSSDTDKNLVSFLETKVQLMLSYCMHVTYYLLLKSEGKKVADHPVIDTLVEIRVYLEKMWPLEEKLQYSLNRLLSGKSVAAVEVDRLRPVQGAESGLAYNPRKSAQSTEASERRKQLRQMREAEELEKEELAAMTRVQSRKASQLGAVNLQEAVTPLGYHEGEDQYFNKLTGAAPGEDDEEEGLSLMEALRRRQAAVQRQQRRSPSQDDDLEEEEEAELEEMEEEEGVSGEDDGDEYEALLREEQERRDKVPQAAPRGKLEVEEVDRRKAGKKIEAHRGLTKARPKDRKNPRVAQRRKYERGMQIHKSQTRTHQPEAEGGFAGVPSIKPGVVRSRTLS